MPKKKILVAAIAGATLLGFGALFTFIVGGSGLGTQEQLAFAMKLLDEGRWDVAGRLARDLESQGLIDPEQDAAWHYVQGVSKLQSVEQQLETLPNREVLWQAAEHLERAETIGFPLGFQGKGHYYLGFCYFHTYRWDKAIEQLDPVAGAWPLRRSDALRMSFAANLNKTPSDQAAANEILVKWEAIPGMSDREHAQISLARARLATIKSEYVRCEEELLSIAPELPEYSEALIARGFWRLQAAADPTQSAKYRESVSREAGSIFRTAIVSAETASPLRQQAAYLSGRNLRQQGRLKDALSTFSGVRQSNPRSAEAIASGIEEAEIMLESRSSEEVVSTLHHVLRNIDDLKLYDASWIPLDELRVRLLRIGRELRDAHEYEKVIQLADHLALAFPLSESVRLQAETYDSWAQTLAEATPLLTIEQQAAHRQQTKQMYLNAANHWEQLAGLELRSAEYPELIWNTIVNLQQAGELPRANKLLAEYLRSEERLKRPRGFLALGSNRMNAGEWQAALEPLERCLIEYPTNPVSYEARLLAAKAKRELNELDEAVELLRSNMGDFQLAPKSQVWQDSLFELGQTIFRRGDQLLLETQLASSTDAPEVKEKLERSHNDFVEAVRSLGEAASRFPDDPRYYETRYLVARAHRLAAQMPETLANSDSTIVESAKRELMQQRRLLLEQALADFRALHQSINDKEAASSFNDRNLPILRNCYFGEADTLFDLGRWEDAISAYRNVASRFLNRPESLEALAQMSICHRKLGREFEAKKTLAQAEQVLKRIPPEYDSHFVDFTRADRGQWQNLLGLMKTWD
ncbi:MAG: tetratricopeptide repeat protein [Pirellulaceae bacterium]